MSLYQSAAIAYLLTNMKHFRSIDALKGIAILGIIAVHCYLYGNNKYIPVFFSNLFSNGRFFVEVFFMISAMTLYASLKSKTHTYKHSTLSFYVKRIIRIAPIYYIAVVYYFITKYGHPLDQDSFKNILANLTFTHGFFPYYINSIVPGGWFVAVIANFYLILPALVKIVKNLKGAVIFTFFSILIHEALFILFNKYPLIADSQLWKAYLDQYFFKQLPLFGLGFILYFLIYENAKYQIGKNISKIFLYIFFIYIFLSLTGMHLLEANPFSYLFFFLILFSILLKPRLIINNFTVLLGKISYGLYLVHFAVLEKLANIGRLSFMDTSSGTKALLNYFIRYYLVLIYSIIIAVILHYLVEIPFKKIGYRLLIQLEKV